MHQLFIQTFNVPVNGAPPFPIIMKQKKKSVVFCLGNSLPIGARDG